MSNWYYLSHNIFLFGLNTSLALHHCNLLIKERMKLTRQVLADKRNSITSVSLQCCFSDVNYFVRLFKKSEGITPGI
jgi:AraC-like DNA-binding protein